MALLCESPAEGFALSLCEVQKDLRSVKKRPLTQGCSGRARLETAAFLRLLSMRLSHGTAFLPEGISLVASGEGVASLRLLKTGKAKPKAKP